MEVQAVTTDIAALADVMTRTLASAGMDRMTDQRIEELMAVPALCAHL
ncbi:hypothetical protein SAMN05421505_1123 [Sinosporangium album]|uniref:Uncharacterized protein n=1 Tax=Sinosporangium album TaxID=504805 RepID=A0A1G8A5A5_9ACTN|nr:hypothetical protein [Sinosporangium album]SDH15580.1 hypothetical protein SAMN05421505_1123 [Sinosporangium album]